MTLEEAIKHAEEVMVENLEKTKGRNASDPIAMNCFECAKEHLQLEKWLKELKQLREQTRWIPVSERLPNFNDIVLASTNSDYDELRVILTVYSGEEFWFNGKIKAWMPLPEPYKAESEDKE